MRKQAQQQSDKVMAIAASELRQACLPAGAEATIYSPTFQRFVLEPTYSREDLRTSLRAKPWALGYMGGYTELRDIDFDADQSAFQAFLAKAWSRGPLCHDVNRCLYKDDAEALELLAPYIQHFREAFRTPSAGRVLKVFDGHLFRYMHPETGGLANYQKDCTIVWPTFSSRTYDEAWLKRSGFVVDVAFEIRSYGALEASTPAEAGSCYVPCLIEEHVLSQYTNQNEVVMPPFCSFRVVNVNKPTGWVFKQTRVFLETTQFPSAWRSIDSGFADEIDEWAKRNPNLLSMAGNDVSMVNEIVKASAKAAVPPAADAAELLGGAHHMLDTCAAMGAPLGEVDPETGSTTVFTIAEIMASLESSTCVAGAVTDSLKSMIKGMARSGANVTIPHKGRRLDGSCRISPRSWKRRRSCSRSGSTGR